MKHIVDNKKRYCSNNKRRIKLTKRLECKEMGTYINIMGTYREITCDCGKKCNKINDLDPDCKICDSCEECCTCNKKEELVLQSEE
ncbi:hypothetical protein [Spiroplasma citri]|uniref:Uncharacterized protein n=1 Tax=Spiroplasma citri TaxID=2133 RepID=A0AAJ4EIJ1_SPICI|nr:hypothetical protein [Spiroplasma citri]APE74407.1 hypothetical protein SCITRI_00504 [Spiroplasma citri]QED24344.1 hypothetical protein FRX96_02365 [Spiroplasma citri]QIA66610.1 hypothetical protein GMI18_02360 [Spiroplasma citri]QIA68492.1 hypothetical protein GL298_02480 [Spiroplasma citri]QIA70368.1 hypothetical protein GL981_02485 [Spiroplasma citri]